MKNKQKTVLTVFSISQCNKDHTTAHFIDQLIQIILLSLIFVLIPDQWHLLSLNAILLTYKIQCHTKCFQKIYISLSNNFKWSQNFNSNCRNSYLYWFFFFSDIEMIFTKIK